MALILDTGPLYASLVRSDGDHAACRQLIETIDVPLAIPAPVLVEVDYWVHVRLHRGVLVALFDDIVAGGYPVEELRSKDYSRVRDLRDRSANADIGFVDAAVLALAERLKEPKLATLDHHALGPMRPPHPGVEVGARKASLKLGMSDSLAFS